LDTNLDRRLLSLAIEQAEIAYSENGTPVGAVLATSSGEVIGYTRSHAKNSETDRTSSLMHAEISLLMEFQCRFNGNEALMLYTSLEPCHMCMGAAILARIKRVIWAADDYWGGATRLYEWGKEYIKLRMPELVRTPFTDLQKHSVDLWINWHTRNNLTAYIPRILHWQARIEA